MDEGLGIALIVIAALVLVFAIVKIVSSKKEDKEDSWAEPDEGRRPSGLERPPERPPEPVSRLGGSLARYWQVKEQEEQDLSEDSTPSLDEAFARANRKWVCPQCEIMHPNEERACRICGYVRS